MQTVSDGVFNGLVIAALIVIALVQFARGVERRAPMDRND
jgi:hypothetical protein